jgi:hypothetical protein
VRYTASDGIWLWGVKANPCLVADIGVTSSLLLRIDMNQLLQAWRFFAPVYVPNLYLRGWNSSYSCVQEVGALLFWKTSIAENSGSLGLKVAWASETIPSTPPHL